MSLLKMGRKVALNKSESLLRLGVVAYDGNTHTPI